MLDWLIDGLIDWLTGWMKEGTNELVSIVSATGEEKLYYQPKCLKPSSTPVLFPSCLRAPNVSKMLQKCKNSWLLDWLIDWLIDLLDGSEWLTDCLTDCLNEYGNEIGKMRDLFF